MALVGLVYAAVIRTTGFHIPCMFFKITGWKCPGCGITTMCMELLQIPFSTKPSKNLLAAKNANPFVFFIGPVILLWIVWKSVLWVKYGNQKKWKYEFAFSVMLLSMTLLWGVMRNF